MQTLERLAVSQARNLLKSSVILTLQLHRSKARESNSRQLSDPVDLLNPSVRAKITFMSLLTVHQRNTSRPRAPTSKPKPIHNGPDKASLKCSTKTQSLRKQALKSQTPKKSTLSSTGIKAIPPKPLTLPTIKTRFCPQVNSTRESVALKLEWISLGH